MSQTKMIQQDPLKSDPKYIVGIDPGKKGAITLMDMSGEHWHTYNTEKLTEHDMASILLNNADKIRVCYIELIRSMPAAARGSIGAFVFGRNCGTWIGILAAARVKYIEVTPQKWMGHLRCRTKGDKNVTKRKAQELFPRLKITHANADSILIAEYGRQKELNLN